MSAPRIGGYLPVRFSDDMTRERYFAEDSGANDNQINEEAPYAWSIVRGYAKIEQGIDRLIVACLVGSDSSPDLRYQLSPVFTFDERLRIVERLVKAGALSVHAKFAEIDGPVAFDGPLPPAAAIRKAMSYRNQLLHEGIFMWIGGNEKGFSSSVWVDGPSGQSTAVPLVVSVDEKPSLFDLVGRLGPGLPFCFGPPMFTPVQGVEIDRTAALNQAFRKSNESRNAGSEKRQSAFEELLETWDCGRG